MSLMLQDFQCSECKIIEEHFYQNSFDGSEDSYVTGSYGEYPHHCKKPMIKLVGAPAMVHSEAWRAVNYRHMNRKAERKPQYFIPR